MNISLWFTMNTCTLTLSCPFLCYHFPQKQKWVVGGGTRAHAYSMTVVACMCRNVYKGCVKGSTVCILFFFFM